MRNWLVIFAVATVAVLGLGEKAFSMGQAPKNLQIIGKITEVNLKTMTVKIAPAKGENVTLQINEKTRLTRGGKSITLPSLKRDDQVTVMYKSSWWKKIALTISAQEQVIAPKKTTPSRR